MFRFSIRELMLVTLVVAMGTGWFCHWRTLEHRNQEQAESVDYYQSAYKMWRGRVEAMDGMLIQIGFEIKEDKSGKSYKPPPSMAPSYDL